MHCRPARRGAHMKGWIDLGSDLAWEDHGGTWGRRIREGMWFVVTFTNMYEECGARASADGSAVPEYIAEARFVDLTDIPDRAIAQAIESLGEETDAPEA